MPDEQFIAVRDAFINKAINQNMGIYDLYLAYQTHKKIYAAFLKKRKMAPNIEAAIKNRYRMRRNLMIKRFLIGKKIRLKKLLSV